MSKCAAFNMLLFEAKFNSFWTSFGRIGLPPRENALYKYCDIIIIIIIIIIIE